MLRSFPASGQTGILASSTRIFSYSITRKSLPQFISHKTFGIFRPLDKMDAYPADAVQFPATPRTSQSRSSQYRGV